MKDKDLLKQKVMAEDDLDEFLTGVLRGIVVEGYCAEIAGELIAKAYHLADTVTFEVGYDKD